ncbi:MAG: hypothetical protein QXT67_04875 [Candidatus Bathyarchaeia archaeon]
MSKKRNKLNVKLQDNEAFIDHLSTTELKTLTEKLRELGLEFEVKIIYCG